MTSSSRFRVIVRTALLLTVAGLLSSVAAAQDAAAAFFDDSAMRTLQLRINSSDWAALQANYKDNTYYPCDLLWEGQTVRNVGIRSRGLGSRNATKPGLRVDFDRYSTDQEFLGLKSFVLDNLSQDASGMRERLSMKLFERLGIPAPRETYVRLMVNNTFAGVYAAVESIDKRFLKRYEGLDADGFLFEYNWLDIWQFQYPGDALETYQSMFSAQTHEKDSISTLYQPVEAFVRTANTSTSFATDIAPFLDVQGFLRFLAAEQFVAEYDGLTGYAGMNNFYLYRTPNRTEFRFVSWDKDNAFKAVDQSIFAGVYDNVLTRRILEQPAWYGHYLDMVLAAANAADARDGEDTSLPTWLQAEIERYYEQIAAAMRQDANKPFTNDEFEASVETLRAFARDRGAFVRSQVQAAQQPQ